MTSILTNIASLNALQTLRSISGALADQQRQVSSGLRVQVAGDNAAYQEHHPLACWAALILCGAYPGKRRTKSRSLRPPEGSL